MANAGHRRRVLVTGASGFVGSAVVTSMAQAGLEVHAAARHPPAEPASVRWHALDLFERQATTTLLARVAPHTIVHAAWYAVPPDYRTSSENLDWVAATMHLAQAFARGGGERFIGIGSGAEYDPAAGTCQEDTTCLRPTDLYGAAKVAVFEVLTSWCRKMGIQFAWPRLFAQYGPGEHPSRVVAYTIRSLLEGHDALCSAGTQRRDFLHVADVGRAITHAALNQVEGPVNIGSGNAISIAEVLAEVGRQLPGKARVVLGERGLHPGEAPVFVPDVGRLFELGFRPSIGLADGIADSIRWWRDRG